MSELTAPLAATVGRLRSFGLNLWGVVDAERFDQGEPVGYRVRERRTTCRSVLVVGAGGNEMWDRVGAARRAPSARLPLEAAARELLGQELRQLHRAGLAASLVLPWERRPLRFMRLAEEAGLGVVSPVLFQLLHPVYGPWVSLQGAFLLDEHVPATGGGMEDFQPCASCSRPCVTACPADVFGPGAVDFRRCAEHRVLGGCGNACDARRHCPVGRDFRHGEEEERLRHQYSLAMMKRYYGMGLWKVVPFVLRRGMR